MWGILLKIGLWAVEQFILRQGGKSKSQKQFYELVKATRRRFFNLCRA